MGSLYPFARNHNRDECKDQEFYALGDKVKDVAIKNLRLRYSILKYYYSLFVINNGAGTVVRPLFFNFYDDINCLKDEIMDN